MSNFDTYIRVCNATSLRIKNMSTDGANKDDWPDKTYREKQFDGQQINAWSYLRYRMILSSTRVHEAKFKLHVTFENGDEITISINQYDAYGDDHAKKQSSLVEDTSNKLQYGVMQRNGWWDEISQTQYIIVALQPHDQWMGKNWTKLGPLPLWQLCMLGTHDAGMSKLFDHTDFANEKNTLTQSKSIEQQLEYGVRYFELRPTVWPKRYGEEVYLGHVQKFDKKYYGGLGESIAEVIKGVKNFYSKNERRNEIAILKFRSWDNVNGEGFGSARKDAFRDLIQSELGSMMFKAQPTDGNRFNLGNVTLEQVRAAGANIICVFQKFNTKDENKQTIVDRCQTSDGFFMYGDYDPTNKNPFPAADLLVADNYGHKPFWPEVATDQLTKYAGFDRKNSALFLLSWTMTESYLDAFLTGVHLPFTSIKAGAEKGNPYLWFAVWDEMMNGTITKKKTMNILFADFVGDNLMNDCAVAVNLFLSR